MKISKHIDRLIVAASLLLGARTVAVAAVVAVIATMLAVSVGFLKLVGMV